MSMAGAICSTFNLLGTSHRVVQPPKSLWKLSALPNRVSLLNHGRQPRLGHVVGPSRPSAPGRRLLVSCTGRDFKPPSSDTQVAAGRMYHPLEDVPKHEKRESNQRLSPAEIARTIAEASHEAVIFASMVTPTSPLIATEVNYVVDEHGDFYFELEDEDSWVENLRIEQTFTVLIGYGSMDDISFDMVVEAEDSDDDEDSDDEVEDIMDLQQGSSGTGTVLELDVDQWKMLEDAFPGGADSLEAGGLTPEALGALGGWGGPETLQWVHPMDFANKLASAATKDDSDDLRAITRRLMLVGTVRRVAVEEEDYVQDLFGDRFVDDYSSDEEEEEEGGEEEEAEAVEVSAGEVEAGDEAGEGDPPVGSPRWKQEMLRAVRQEVKDLEDALAAAAAAEVGGEGELVEKKGSAEESGGVVRNGLWMGEPINGWARKVNGWDGGSPSPISSSAKGGLVQDHVDDSCAELQKLMQVVDSREEEEKKGLEVGGVAKERTEGGGEGEEEDGVDEARGAGEEENQEELGRGGKPQAASDSGSSEDGQAAAENARGSSGSSSAKGVIGEEADLGLARELRLRANGEEVVVTTWVAVGEEEADGSVAFSSGELTPGELEGLRVQLGSFLTREMSGGGAGGTGEAKEEGGGGESDEEGDNAVRIVTISSSGPLYYKLDLAAVHLDASTGEQISIGRMEFAAATPDLLANSAEDLVESINDGGRRTIGRLINAVRRDRGLDPEEAAVVGIDHLGIDLRVQCGIEVSTIRLPFRRPATCQEHAEQLLKELLHPKRGKKGKGQSGWQLKRKSKK